MVYLYVFVFTGDRPTITANTNITRLEAQGA